MEIQADIQSRENDKELDEEDRINSIKTLEKQLFWLNNLENYFTSNGMEFEIYNQIEKKFQSKINELTNKGVLIWFDSLKEAREISRALNVYKTNEITKEEEKEKKKKQDQNKVIYWYI